MLGTYFLSLPQSMMIQVLLVPDCRALRSRWALCQTNAGKLAPYTGQDAKQLSVALVAIALGGRSQGRRGAGAGVAHGYGRHSYYHLVRRVACSVAVTNMSQLPVVILSDFR